MLANGVSALEQRDGERLVHDGDERRHRPILAEKSRPESSRTPIVSKNPRVTVSAAASTATWPGVSTLTWWVRLPRGSSRRAPPPVRLESR